MSKHLFLLVFICLIINGCKKGVANFVVRGTIQDQTFQAPLSGAIVKLYQVPVGTTQKVLIGSQTLLSDGKYSFTFPRDKMEKYILKVSKNEYFDLEETIFFSSLDLENENIKNYSTTAKSWAKIHLINQNPQIGDQLTYMKQQGKVGCADCCPAVEYNFYGALDTVFYCINDGNTTYSFLYGVSGTSNSGIRSVTTVAFDTTEILLSY